VSRAYPVLVFGLYLLALVLAVATAKGSRGHAAPAVWVHGRFASCVRQRESQNGADPNARHNLYGVKDASGGYRWAEHVSRAKQDYIAWRLYKRWGDQPWRPYDGCEA